MSEPSSQNVPSTYTHAPPCVEFGDLLDDHFLSIRKKDGRFVVRGTERLFVGHRLGDEGAFLQWEWTGEHLTIRNDRYGLFPAYFSTGPDHFLVATSIRQLIEEGVSPDLDYDGLAVFLRFGTFVGDDTPFAAIRALPPATSFTWSGCGEVPAGSLVLGKEAIDLAREEACKRYGDLFGEALRKRCSVEGDLAVALSGGMDSRHILLELCRIGRKPTFCVTAHSYRGESSEDLDLARRVTQALGVPHVQIDQGGNWVKTEVEKIRATNLCALEHNWGMVVGPYLHGRAVAVFDGLGGDVFSDCRSVLTPERHAAFRAGRLAALAEDYLGHEDGCLSYLVPDLARMMTRERAVARLALECERFVPAPNPAAAFIFWNRTRRAVSTLPHAVWNRSVHVLTPFLDHALFDFLVSLPVDLVQDYTFHAETLSRRYPDVAHIPFFTGPCRRPKGRSVVFRRMGWDLLTLGLRTYPSSYVSHRYLLARFLRAIVDPGYRSSLLWLGPHSIYGLELENCSKRHNAQYRSEPCPA